MLLSNNSSYNLRNNSSVYSKQFNRRIVNIDESDDNDSNNSKNSKEIKRIPGQDLNGQFDSEGNSKFEDNKSGFILGKFSDNSSGKVNMQIKVNSGPDERENNSNLNS